MKYRFWNYTGALGVTLAGMCLLLNACAGLVSTGGGGGGGGTPAVSMSPGSLTFASQTVNTTSAAQSVTLTNTGSAALSLTSITITGTNSGDFAETNTCGGSVNANASCTVSLTFTPTASGSRTANVSITDNATGSPQTVSLTGTGASAGGTPAMTLAPTSLTFASQTVNTTSAAQNVTLTNSGSGTLTLTSITVTGTNSGDFSATNTCGGSVNANASCTISVTFTPTANGARAASVSITDGATGSPQTVSLTGTGGSTSSGTGAPAIFFTDLESGPNSGGENGNGTILTIYGERFGAVQGTSTVTVGGGLVADYKLWSDTKVAVAIGSKAATGEVLVQTLSGTSNGVSFTIRTGNIFCVSTSGSDSNSGAFPSSCWATIPKAKNTIAAGDIAYIEDGVTATTDDGFSSAVSVQTGGTATNPKALVAYPGANVTVGVDSGAPASGIKVPDISITADYWVIAGLHLHGSSAGLALGGVNGTTGWRIIGNDVTCPNGDGAAACFFGGLANQVKAYGNRVHDVAVNVNASKLYHAVYWTTNSNHIDFGWNEIGPSQACRGIQFHSTQGANQFDLHVHDNFIHDIRCDGINFATVDPSLGPVEAFNNVIVHVGAGPDPPDGVSDYSGVFVPNSTDATGPCVTGCVVKVYNNTIYDAGSGGTITAHACFAVGTGPNSILAQNNICQQTNSALEQYILAQATITCDTNLFFGIGGAPASCTNSFNSDPLFVSITNRDFHLLVGSPAIDKALSPPCPVTDKDGITRPQGALCDLGAYEFH